MTRELDPDSELRHDILDALDECEELTGGFGISVSAGVVTLSVLLQPVTPEEKATAGRVIRSVSGVHAVRQSDGSEW